MNPEETYLQNLSAIERIAAFVGRRNHLCAEETADFTQAIRIRLFEDDYAIIRKFEGRSSITTYLTTVVTRLFHEWRVEQWGKWRPSAEAKRLGDKAITLERMLARDGYTVQEAVKILTAQSDSIYTVSELESIYVRLPLRSPRPVLVSDEALVDEVALDASADDRVESANREQTVRAAAKAIDTALSQLDPEDRLILQMRFWNAQKVPDIARRLQVDQKKIYKRLDRLFALLRHALESSGVSRADTARLLEPGDQELRLDLLLIPDTTESATSTATTTDENAS